MNSVEFHPGDQVWLRMHPRDPRKVFVVKVTKVGRVMVQGVGGKSRVMTLEPRNLILVRRGR